MTRTFIHGYALFTHTEPIHPDTTTPYLAMTRHAMIYETPPQQIFILNIRKRPADRVIFIVAVSSAWDLQ